MERTVGVIGASSHVVREGAQHGLLQRTWTLFLCESLGEDSCCINKGALSSNSLERGTWVLLVASHAFAIETAFIHTQLLRAGTRWFYLCRLPPQSCLCVATIMVVCMSSVNPDLKCNFRSNRAVLFQYHNRRLHLPSKLIKPPLLTLISSLSPPPSLAFLCLSCLFICEGMVFYGQATL